MIMAKTHNKKRNIGIIYDQMISSLCESYIENDLDKSQKLLKIIKECFKKGTQLQKELQFFNSFLKMRGLPQNLSSEIIREAKTASRSHFNSDQLELEKSKLIKLLNYTFGKGVIFEKKVKNYKMYATIQTLLNEWRNEENNFSETVKYELKLNEWLTSESKVLSENSEYDNIDKVTLKIMSNKFNEKYKGLTESQSYLISNYIKSKNNNDKEITEFFKELKEETINLLENYKASCGNQYILNKYNVIHENITSLNENKVSEDNLKKFLTVSKLKDELLGE
tara:strand:- start:2663 stop:3505 length:843 start_codon:yes stop_codon:yes gene_type:complete